MKFSMFAIAAAALSSGVSGFAVNQGRFAVRSVSIWFKLFIARQDSLILTNWFMVGKK